MCATQWKLVETMSSRLSSMLPVCEDFEDTDIDYSTNLQNMHAPHEPLQCHYQFKEFCSLCVPLCGKFSQYKDKTKLQRERSVLIFSGTSATIGGILVFIAAVVRRKKM